MGINAMDSQGIQPQDIGVWGKARNAALALLGSGLVIYGGAVGIKAGYNYFTVPAPIAAIVEKAQSPTQSNLHRVYTSEGYTEVAECTAVGGDCASQELGPPADYGTGFHTSADGRTRPNPPAGWQWGGK